MPSRYKRRRVGYKAPIVISEEQYEMWKLGMIAAEPKSTRRQIRIEKAMRTRYRRENGPIQIKHYEFAGLPLRDLLNMWASS